MLICERFGKLPLLEEDYRFGIDYLFILFGMISSKKVLYSKLNVLKI